MGLSLAVLEIPAFAGMTLGTGSRREKRCFPVEEIAMVASLPSKERI